MPVERGEPEHFTVRITDAGFGWNGGLHVS